MSIITIHSLNLSDWLVNTVLWLSFCQHKSFSYCSSHTVIHSFPVACGAADRMVVMCCLWSGEGPLWRCPAQCPRPWPPPPSAARLREWLSDCKFMEPKRSSESRVSVELYSIIYHNCTPHAHYGCWTDRFRGIIWTESNVSVTIFLLLSWVYRDTVRSVCVLCWFPPAGRG